MTVSSGCDCSCHCQPGQWCEKHAATLIGVVPGAEFTRLHKKQVGQELNVCKRLLYFPQFCAEGTFLE